MGLHKCTTACACACHRKPLWKFWWVEMHEPLPVLTKGMLQSFLALKFNCDGPFRPALQPSDYDACPAPSLASTAPSAPKPRPPALTASPPTPVHPRSRPTSPATQATARTSASSPSLIQIQMKYPRLSFISVPDPDGMPPAASPRHRSQQALKPHKP